MATELIKNGSFETGTGTSPTNWTGSAPGSVLKTTGIAPDGAAYYALGANSANHGGYVQQTIATEVGKTYTIHFRAGIATQANANARVDATLKVDTLAGAALVSSQTVELSSQTKVGWGDYSLTFTATSAQTTLRFTDTSPNGQIEFDVGLDNISVQQAPSPTTGGA